MNVHYFGGYPIDPSYDISAFDLFSSYEPSISAYVDKMRHVIKSHLLLITPPDKEVYLAEKENEFCIKLIEVHYEDIARKPGAIEIEDRSVPAILCNRHFPMISWCEIRIPFTCAHTEFLRVRPNCFSQSPGVWVAENSFCFYCREDDSNSAEKRVSQVMSWIRTTIDYVNILISNFNAKLKSELVVIIDEQYQLIKQREVFAISGLNIPILKEYRQSQEKLDQLLAPAKKFAEQTNAIINEAVANIPRIYLENRSITTTQSNIHGTNIQAEVLNVTIVNQKADL